ncbi:hypothetical protein IV203_003851 [Nitzschia inconspicua]|uniref:Uncharacterized protein n=1 Tax=Nitzschia inconspicua TaxID=303405 RepID=A0A9K3L4A6_9STRA|nr:hypothetical protein IV203_003851 [Nitzschia inconspicua]
MPSNHKKVSVTIARSSRHAKLWSATYRLRRDPPLFPVDDVMDTAETVPLPAFQDRNPWEHHMFPTSSPYTDSDPAVSPKGPTSLRAAQREALVQTLDPVVQDALNCKYGKPTSSNLSFTAECRFRHVIPALVRSAFVSPRDLQLLDATCPLVGVYVSLEMEFAHHNVEYARGFVSYADYATETTVNKQRVHSTIASLFLCGFSIPKLVRFLGGPHLGATRDVDKILQTLQPSVDPEILQELHRVFVYGAPRYCQGSSTEDNFLAVLRYGNHASANSHPDELRKVFVKDLRRGFAIAIDKRLLPFIPDLHVTPLGIVDIENPWKQSRPVFDSSFHPLPDSMAINDWTNKSSEPRVVFPGDNDITGAFRLIKYNPWMVSLHGFVVDGYLGFATGQTFGDTASPGNFEIPAIARQQHAAYLWLHKQEEVLHRARHFIAKMSFLNEATFRDKGSFSSANADSCNHGVLFPDGSRRPPPYPHQVDDCLFADTIELMPLTAAASMIALEDVFGPKHECHEHILSMDKLNLAFDETRDMLGHHVDTRRMVITLASRRRDKILSFIEQEGWLAPKRATIQELASVYGLLDNASEFFMGPTYGIAKRSIQVQERVSAVKKVLPRQLYDRLSSMQCRIHAEFVWHNNWKVSVDTAVRRGIRIIYDYLKSGLPWEQPIGHVVKRDPTFTLSTDLSEEAVGVCIPTLKIISIIPLSEGLWKRATLLQKHRDKLHINCLEFIGIIEAAVILSEWYHGRENQFPPHPMAAISCDNTSAISWCRKMSTASVTGQNLLRLLQKCASILPLAFPHLTLLELTMFMSQEKRVRILDSLPSVARSAIGPMLDAVFECELGAGKKPKEQWYFGSMRLHFIWFLQQHHLYNSLLPVVKLSLETMNYVLACYACHLATGHSLSSLTLRTGTIRKYLIAAASLIAIFDSEPGRDARKGKGSDSLCSPLEKVLKEQKRWEDVPDRREGWTVGLQLALMKKYSHFPFRGKHQTITDWFVVALHGGFRRAEWAQDRSHTKLNQPERNVRNDPAAFCLDDVQFKGDNGRPLLHSSVLQSPESAIFVTVRWRMQKNGDHGKKKLFTRNDEDNRLCCVHHWIRIIRRFVDMQGFTSNIPLACYWSQYHDQSFYITSTDIETAMRDTAAEYYELDSVKHKDIQPVVSLYCFDFWPLSKQMWTQNCLERERQ